MQINQPRILIVGNRESLVVGHRVSEDEHLRHTILFMLRKLNSDGLMEVMEATLAATKNPSYLRKGDL